MRMLKVVFVGLFLMLSQALYAGPVNINEADVSALSAELKGVGEKKAQAIIEYRKLNGPFKNVDDLQNVKGISVKTIDKNRQNITL